MQYAGFRACGIGDTGIAETDLPTAGPSETTSAPSLPDTPGTDGESSVSHPLNSSTEGVRILGVRNLAAETGINCDWSCSGIELTVRHEGGDLRFNISSTAGCYFRAYVDGEVWYFSEENPYCTVNLFGKLTLTDLSAGVHTVRVTKVTGYTLARAQILSVDFKGEILTDDALTADSELYFEFVGDSITCGWGTIGNHAGAYTDQDGTYAFSYLLAEKYGADYSMTALSGQGLLCGTPGVTNGYLYASALRDTSEQYAFERKADLVVINIGTNDYAQRNNLGITEATFREAYLSFLQTVREKNGADCKIVCLYNVMNDTFANAIISACAEMGGEASGIYCLKMPRSAGNQHPTIEEQKICAAVLEDVINRALATPSTVIEGYGSVIDWESVSSITD